MDSRMPTADEIRDALDGLTVQEVSGRRPDIFILGGNTLRRNGEAMGLPAPECRMADRADRHALPGKLLLHIVGHNARLTVQIALIKQVESFLRLSIGFNQ